MDERFRKDLYTKSIFAGIPSTWTPDQLYVKSDDWDPPNELTEMSLKARTSYFLRCLKQSFRSRRVSSNLSPIQLHTLSILEKSKDFIVCPTDKNLGPCILEREQYIQQVFCLLNDKDTYLRLSEFDASCFQTQLQGKLQAWFQKYIWIISSEDWKYLERTSNASNKSLDQLCAHFYIMPKIHKSPWKPRPIVSYAGSFLYGLGKWLDKKLQPICRKLPTYCSSSFDLIADLKTYESDFNPETDRLFTADANSMYTNIDTTHAINQLRMFFKTSDYCTTIQREADCIIDALELLMKYNIIKFDDTYWLQLQGTAMGAPPAPAYATIYYAIHELTFLALYPIRFYKRYIDDLIGVWRISSVDDLTKWNNFKQHLTFGKLTWEVQEPTDKVNFLDLWISFPNGRLQTSIYEKPMNLYLYLPPKSAHSPGVLQGTVIGTIYRYWRLISERKEFQSQCEKFFHRLIARGYSPDKLRNLFATALNRIPTIATQNKNLNDNNESLERLLDNLRRQCYIHLTYHPLDPPRRYIQQLARDCLLHPKGEPTLHDLRNNNNIPIGIDRLIVAYHRAPNIRDHLFHRKFNQHPGPAASTFIAPSTTEEQQTTRSLLQSYR
jgi:hypothetical protein